MDFLSSWNWGEVATFVALEGTFIGGLWRIQSLLAHQDRRIDALTSTQIGHHEAIRERCDGREKLCDDRHKDIKETFKAVWERINEKGETSP